MVILPCHISVRRSPWAENGRQWLSRPDPTQIPSGEQGNETVRNAPLKWHILSFLAHVCFNAQMDSGPALHQPLVHIVRRDDEDHWECHVSIEIWMEYSIKGCFLCPLPPGHYQGEGRGCSCGPCLETWTPHSGRPGHPALWWVWRGSARYRSPLKVDVNTDKAKDLKYKKTLFFASKQQ